jgi:RHS repeat-associated protein
VVKRFYPQGVEVPGASSPANKLFYTRDHLGSIRELTDNASTPAVRARYAYDPYGRVTKLSGDLDADFAFTGHYRHAKSGLHLALYRAYDAELGRWLSRDPIAEDGGINLYGYVKNVPTMFVDPLGLQPFNPYKRPDGWDKLLNPNRYISNEWECELHAALDPVGRCGPCPSRVHLKARGMNRAEAIHAVQELFKAFERDYCTRALYTNPLILCAPTKLRYNPDLLRLS